MYTYYEHFKSYLCLSNRFSSTLGLFVTGCIIHLSVEAADFHRLHSRGSRLPQIKDRHVAFGHSKTNSVKTKF